MTSPETLKKLPAPNKHYFAEQATRVIYSKLARSGDTVIDCGANHGDHTRILSSLVGPKGRVHAFEPNFELYPLLLAIGDNVRLWPFAAGEALRLETLHVPTGLDGWASLNDIRSLLPERKFTLRNTVQVALDSLAELKPPIRFIKVDVEGREINAIRGMKRLLIQSRPQIVFENLTKPIENFLATIGFKVLEMTGAPIADRPIFHNVLAYPEKAEPAALTDEDIEELIEIAARLVATNAPTSAPAPKP